MILWPAQLIIVVAIACPPFHASADDEAYLVERLEELARGLLDHPNPYGSIRTGGFGWMHEIVPPSLEEDEDVRTLLNNPWYSFEGESVPAVDLIPALAKQGEVAMVPSEGVVGLLEAKGRLGGLRGKDLTFADAMDRVARSLGSTLAWRVRGGKVEILTPEEAEQEKLAHQRLREGVLDRLARKGVRKLDDRYLLLTMPEGAETEARERVRKLIAERRITVNFEETPLDVVVTFIADIGAPVVLSERAERIVDKDSIAVTLSLQSTTVKEVLDKLLEPLGKEFFWMVEDDGVHIRSRREPPPPDSRISFFLVDIEALNWKAPHIVGAEQTPEESDSGD